MKRSNAWLTAVLALAILSGCSAPTTRPQEHHNIDSVYDRLDKPLTDRGWESYRRHSSRIEALDEAYMERELQEAGLEEPLRPPRANRFGFDTNQPADFYTSDEGRQIADIVLSFQTPSGGWSKRTDMGERPRRTGEAFGYEKSYIPTFDNGATTTQFWVLTHAHEVTNDERYRDAVLRALKLILVAQYPNGGWPQTYPLSGGYNDDITYNDGVMSNLLSVVHAASEGRSGLDFVPEALRAQAAISYERAIEAVLATQVIVNGERTIWGAQHDPHSMLPTSARAYEPEALATAESAHLLLVLMRIDDPSEPLKRAISGAIEWFDDNAIYDHEWGKSEEGNNRLRRSEGAGPLWGRFVEIGTNKPVFGDRDGEIYYDVHEISQERRNGYGWYTDSPARVLEVYEEWKARHLDD